MPDLAEAVLAALDAKSDDAYWLYRATVEALLGLHQPCDVEQIGPDGGAIWGKNCVECGSDAIGSYPCPTVRAIAEKLGVEAHA